MKTKLFLIVALFAASLSQGQIIINEDFNASTSLPAGWSSNGSGTSTQSCDGNSFRRNVYNTGGNSTMTLTTPNQISASNGNDISVSVDYKVVNWSAATVATPATFGTLKLQYSVDDGSTWTTFSTIDSSNHVVSNICAPISGVIPAAAVPMNSDVKIRTLTNYNAGDYYMYNDNFVAIQGGVCLPPGGINASNVLSTSADFAWTDSTEEDAGYNWEVVPAGSGQGVGVVASGTTAANAVMVSATGLTSGTNYDFYIQSNCGGSTSSWSAPLSFSTQAGCGDTLSGLCYSQTSTIEVLASFSASSGDWAEIVFNSGGTEACCDEVLVYDGLNGTGNLIYGALTGGGITDVSTIGSVVSTTGNISLAINSDGSVTCSSSTSVDPISITLNCVTPPSCLKPLNLGATSITFNSAELSWTTGGSGESSWEVEYGLDGFTQGTVGGTIVTASTNPFNLTSLTESTDYDYYVRANCGGGDFSEWEGPFSFSTPASCLVPTSLAAGSITADSAELSWTSGGSGETSWEVEYGIDGFTQGTGTIVSPATNPQSVTGLTSNTDYNYYVRANCGGGDYSEWSGPFSFTTLVGPHNFPLYEDFESGLSLFDNAPGNSTDFTLTSTYYHTGSQSVQNAHGSSDLNYLHETGVLDLSTSSSPELRFWQIAKTEGTYDECYVQISTDGGMTYTNLPASAYSGNSLDYDTEGYFHEDSYAIWGTTDSTPDNATWWQEEVFSLDAYKVANVRIRFFLDSDFSENREGWFIDDIAVQEAPIDYIWDGTSWNTVPEGNITSNDNMIVQSGTMPSLTSAISVGNLTVEASASIEADNGDITVAGNVVNDGIIEGSNEVILTSATATVSGAGSMTNLTVGASGTVAINGAQSILEQLDVMSGGSLNANGNVTLVSNAFGTARVDEVDMGSITGNVNVERFIPAGNRAFRFIGSTVSGPTVYDSWQEGGNNAAGFGVQVTGTAGTVGNVNATTGHDESATGANSMYKWDASSQAWTSVDNTKTEVLNAGDYYRLFVRGDRTTDLANNTAAHTATTLRATGSLMIGSMTVTPGIATGEFFALANPFQSKVSMAGTTTGTTADMYYWDPNLGTRGGYSAIDIASGTGTAGVATNVLDAGQAVFFIDAAGAASVTINEANKVSGNNNGGVFNTSPLTQALRLKLYQTTRFNNGQTESDGLYVDFDATHNFNVDSNDAVKLNGLNANMAIAKTTGELLAVERRTLPTANETLGLHISNYLTNAYTINATVDVLPGLTAYLKDNFTGTMTELVQGTSTAVDFTVDINDAQSSDPLRFEIVFQNVTLSNEDAAFGANLSVYPNPVTGDVITINLGDATVEKATVAIYNTLGQQVLSNSYDSVSNGIIELNSLSGLSNGVYIMNISSGDATTTRRFIKE